MLAPNDEATGNPDGPALAFAKGATCAPGTMRGAGAIVEEICAKDDAMNFELSADERTLLAGMLDQAVRDIKAEIHHTDTADYKDQLKERETIMLNLLNRLNAAS